VETEPTTRLLPGTGLDVRTVQAASALLQSSIIVIGIGLARHGFGGWPS
jgi:hypothetical protein